MTECRHGNAPEECYLCQEEISAHAASLGRRGGMARKFALGDDRRAEIARLAARQRWDHRIGSGIKVASMRTEERERRRQAALRRFEGILTKKKIVLSALQTHMLVTKTQISVDDAISMAAKIGCSVEYVKKIAKEVDLFTPTPRSEYGKFVSRASASRGSMASRARTLLRDEPHLTRKEIRDRTGIHSSSLAVIIKKIGANPRERLPRSQEFDLAQIAQDISIRPIMARLRTLTRQKYSIPRIAQLLDLPEEIGRAYIQALPKYRFTKTDMLKRMTEEDVKEAYALWKAGSTPASIAKRLGFTQNQVEKRLLSLRRKLGEA